MGYPIPGSLGYLTGFGAISAVSVTTSGAVIASGRVTGAGFTSSTDGSAGTPAYGYSSTPGLGMYRVSNYNSFAVGSAQKFVAGTEVASASAIPLQALGSLDLFAQGAASIGADQDNYAGPVSAAASSFWAITPTGASRTITGVANGSQGRILFVVNDAASGSGLNLVLANASASSLAANRILGTNGAAVTIPPQGMAVLRHNGTNWRAGLFA